MHVIANGRLPAAVDNFRCFAPHSNTLQTSVKKKLQSRVGKGKLLEKPSINAEGEPVMGYSSIHGEKLEIVFRTSALLYAGKGFHVQFTTVQNKCIS